MSDSASLVEFPRPVNKKRSAHVSDIESCLSREDFDVFAREYTDRLLAVAARFVRSPEDAADAVQDALLAAYVSRHRFRGQSTVYTWLYRIVTNTCLMRLRSLASRKSRNLQMSRFSDDGLVNMADVSLRTPVGDLERDEQATTIRGKLKQLTEDHQTILHLRDMEGLTTSETADRLCISEEAVKARVCRARQALRGLMVVIEA